MYGNYRSPRSVQDGTTPFNKILAPDGLKFFN